MGLPDGEEIMTLAFFVLTQYRLVTDRQMDTLRSLLPAQNIHMYTHLYLRALLLAVMGTTSEFYNGVSSEYISISKTILLRLVFLAQYRSVTDRLSDRIATTMQMHDKNSNVGN